MKRVGAASHRTLWHISEVVKVLRPASKASSNNPTCPCSVKYRYGGQNRTVADFGKISELWSNSMKPHHAYCR